MNANQMLRKIFKEGGKSSSQVSREIGHSRNYINSSLSRDINLGVDNLATILDAADYDLLARHRSSGKEYVITPRK